FLHAIWSGTIEGERCALVGNRKEGRDLLRLTFVGGTYQVDGLANCWAFSDGGHDHIIAANRETNEVALYDCSK
ncbi:MAG: hypothetical protein ACRC75_06995, partial [Olsenella sp.]